MAVAVYLERGTKKVFACALDFPGWCRSGKTDDDALAALADYAPRFAPVAAAVGARFPAKSPSLEVVETVKGDGGTDFGVPHKPAKTDLAAGPLSAAQARRLAAYVEASWDLLASVAASSPEKLRRGPRGGGRDTSAIVQHVFESEEGYARQLGVRVKDPDARRQAIAAALAAARSGDPLVPKGWPVRYAARRLAWHALDHAWEIEDKRD